MPSDSGYTRRRYEEDERRSVDMDDHHRSWTKRVTMPMDVAKAILDLSGSNGEKIKSGLKAQSPKPSRILRTWKKAANLAAPISHASPRLYLQAEDGRLWLVDVPPGEGPGRAGA